MKGHSDGDCDWTAVTGCSAAPAAACDPPVPPPSSAVRVWCELDSDDITTQQKQAYHQPWQCLLWHLLRLCARPRSFARAAGALAARRAGTGKERNGEKERTETNRETCLLASIMAMREGLWGFILIVLMYSYGTEQNKTIRTCEQSKIDLFTFLL
jgi:hypothetical protein